MKTWLLEREQWVPRPPEVCFEFFSRAENLGRITPPWLRFRILTSTPVAMRVGARIEYTIRLAGVPVRWRTVISVWEPPRRFVDVQERGPYSLWEHHHEFRPLGDGVLMTDRVRYAVPLGPLGLVAHRLAVRSALEAIFDYRFRRIRELLPPTAGAGAAPAERWGGAGEDPGA